VCELWRCGGGGVTLCGGGAEGEGGEGGVGCGEHRGRVWSIGGGAERCMYKSTNTDAVMRYWHKNTNTGFGVSAEGQKGACTKVRTLTCLLYWYKSTNTGFAVSAEGQKGACRCWEFVCGSRVWQACVYVCVCVCVSTDSYNIWLVTVTQIN
jgi:hypothetical protein